MKIKTIIIFTLLSCFLIGCEPADIGSLIESTEQTTITVTRGVTVGELMGWSTEDNGLITLLIGDEHDSNFFCTDSSVVIDEVDQLLGKKVKASWEFSQERRCAVVDDISAVE